MNDSTTAPLPAALEERDISVTEDETPDRRTPASLEDLPMIRNTIFAAAAALTLMSGAAMAQTVTQADVGSFVRDSSGQAIGSLQAIQNGQAVVHLGFFNTPGNRLVTLPLNQLADNGGRLVLNTVPGAAMASSR